MSKAFDDLKDDRYDALEDWAYKQSTIGKLYGWGLSEKDGADSATIWVPFDAVYEEPLMIDGIKINIVRTSPVDPE